MDLEHPPSGTRLPSVRWHVAADIAAAGKWVRGIAGARRAVVFPTAPAGLMCRCLAAALIAPDVVAPGIVSGADISAATRRFFTEGTPAAFVVAPTPNGGWAAMPLEGGSSSSQKEGVPYEGQGDKALLDYLCAAVVSPLRDDIVVYTSVGMGHHAALLPLLKNRFGGYCGVAPVTCAEPASLAAVAACVRARSPKVFVEVAAAVVGETQLEMPPQRVIVLTDAVVPSLAACDVIVLTDAAKQLPSLWRDAAVREFVRSGGRVWCPTYAEHVLRGFTSPRVSRPDLLASYGAHVEPDPAIAMTTVFKGQVARMPSTACRMDVILLAVEIATNGGVSVVEGTKDLIENVTHDARLARLVLRGYIPSSVALDLRKDWRWSHREHVEPYLFGGSVQFGKGQAMPLASDVVPTVELAHAGGTLHSISPHYFAPYMALCNIPALPSSSLESKMMRVKEHIDKHGTSHSYRIVCFDIESTGLNVRTDRIVEIAMYDALRDRSFTTLVNPQRTMPPEVILIHGLTDETVAHAPTWAEALPSIVNFLDIDPSGKELVLLCAHCCALFDEPILLREFHDAKVPFPKNIVFVDSMGVFKHVKQRRFTTINSFGLSSILDALNINPSGPMHRAMTDVKGLWDAMSKIVAGDGAAAHAGVLRLMGETLERSWTNCLERYTGSFGLTETAATAVCPGVIPSTHRDGLSLAWASGPQEGVPAATIALCAEAGVGAAEAIARVLHLAVLQRTLERADRPPEIDITSSPYGAMMCTPDWASLPRGCVVSRHGPERGIVVEASFPSLLEMCHARLDSGPGAAALVDACYTTGSARCVVPTGTAMVLRPEHPYGLEGMARDAPAMLYNWDIVVAFASRVLRELLADGGGALLVAVGPQGVWLDCTVEGAVAAVGVLQKQWRGEVPMIVRRGPNMANTVIVA